MPEYGTQNRIVGFNAEGTSGTYDAPIAADFDVTMYELSALEWDYGMNRQGKPATGDLTNAQSKSGIISGTFTGKTTLDYTGAQGTAPNQGKLFIAAGLVESGAATQIVYTYNGTQPCGTLSAIVSDLDCGAAPVSIDKMARGIAPNLVFNFPAPGQEVTCDWTFSAAYGGETDNAAPIKVLTGLDTGASEKLDSPSFSFGDVTYILQSASLDMGNSVTMIKDPDKLGNIFKYKVTGSDPKFTCSVIKQDVATSTIPTDIIGDTVFNPINISGAHWTFSITDANLISAKDGDAEGTVSEELEFEVRAFTLTQAD